MTELEILRSLLREWLTWWSSSDEAPPKLPNALHVRTTLVLLVPREETHDA